MTKTKHILALLVLLQAPCFSQDQGRQNQGGDQPIPLAVTAKIKTPLHAALLGRDKCDEDGNVYLRPIYAGSNPKYHFQSPIQKLAPDGTPSTLYRNSGDLPEDFIARDFAVTPDGNFYEIASRGKPREAYVLSFSADGTEKSRLKLEGPRFAPVRFAVFKSGEYLISGVTDWPDSSSFVAVFDTSGKVVKILNESAEKAGKDDNGADIRQTSDSPIRAAEKGEAIGAPDGNVYLLRATSPTQVLAISPGGEVVRRFSVDPGQPGMTAHSMKASREGLAITFMEEHGEGPERVIKTVTYSGDPLAQYTISDRHVLAAFLACYASDGLTFVSTSEDGFVYLQTLSTK